MKKSLIFAAFASAMLANCSNEDVPVVSQVQTEKSELGVSADISGTVNTRAGIKDGEVFGLNDAIAVFIAGTDGTTAYTQKVATYTYSGTKWISPDDANKIYLYSALGTVYGFCPVTSVTGIGDAATINVSVPAAESSFAGTNQIDYMFVPAGSEGHAYTTGTDIYNGVSNALNKSDVKLTFKHALSKLSFVVNKAASYTGTGKLTKVELASDVKFNTAGTMLIKDGSFTWTTTSNASSISFLGSTTINAVNGTDIKVAGLVAPRTTNKSTTYDVSKFDFTSNIVLKLTIDDKVMSVNLPINNTAPYVGSTWDAGNNYKYTITVKGTELIVSSVSITKWNDIPVGEVSVN